MPNVIRLGLAFAGLSLRAIPLNTAGVSQGSPISAGFTDLGQGDYNFEPSTYYPLYRITKADGTPLITIPVDPVTDGVSVSVTPISATIIAPNTDAKTIPVFQNTVGNLAFVATDGSGDPIVLEDHELQFRVFKDFWQVSSTIFVIGAEDIVTSGNSATVPFLLAHTATPGRHSYVLRDLTADLVVATGIFEIRPMP